MMGRPSKLFLSLSCVAGSIFFSNLEVTAQEVTAPDPSPQVRGPIPKDIGSWVGRIIGNYPSEAARNNLEGSARVKVTVDPQGRVTDCIVQKTSGHAILDEAACDGMRQFSVFNPAIDATGSPTSGGYSIIITYRDTGPPAAAPVSNEGKDAS